MASDKTQNPLFFYYKDWYIDNVTVETDSDDNPVTIELYSNGLLIAKKYIVYDGDGNIANIKTEWIPPPIEGYYS